MKVSDVAKSSFRLMNTYGEYAGYTYRPSTQKTLEKVAKDEGYVDSEIVCYGQVGKGQGVTGDLYFANIYGANNRLECLVKQATINEKVREYFPVHNFYKNEANFYSLVWPEFEKQQQRRLGRLIFDNVPKHYGSNVNPEEECVILENVKSKGYYNINRKETLTEDILQLIIKKYGQFHALSYVLKKSDPRKFEELTQKFIPYWEGADKIIPLKVSINDVFNKSLTYLKKTANLNQDLMQKMEGYLKTGLDVFIKSNDYQGKNGVFLHGDCWSNNMLFKFSELPHPIAFRYIRNFKFNQIEDLKFIDFQTCKLGSAVYDLSYCIYSGGSKEIFDNLDQYLQLYHSTLADTCQQMGCDEYISMEELKQEWKDYCKFGWIMAMVILRAKLVHDDTKLDLLLMLNEFEKRSAQAHLEDADEVEIEKRTLVILEHMHKNGFI